MQGSSAVMDKGQRAPQEMDKAEQLTGDAQRGHHLSDNGNRRELLFGSVERGQLLTDSRAEQSARIFGGGARAECVQDLRIWTESTSREMLLGAVASISSGNLAATNVALDDATVTN